MGNVVQHDQKTKKMTEINTQNITITKHALQRAVERILPVKGKIAAKIIIADVKKNFALRKPANHPAKWNIITKLAQYLISEDLSILTVIKNH